MTGRAGSHGGMRGYMRNLSLFAGAEFLWGFAWTLAIEHPIPATFAKDTGAGSGLVGVLTLGTALALGLTILVSPWILTPLRRKAGLVFWGHLAAALVLVGLAALLGLGLIQDPGVLSVVYPSMVTVFFLLIGLQGPAWFSLIGDLYPDHLRTRMMGLTFTSNRLGGVLAGVINGVLLDQPWSSGDKWGCVFLIAGLAMVVGSFPFLALTEKPRVRRRRPPFLAYLGELRDELRVAPDLARFLVWDGLSALAMVLVAYYGDAALRLHHAPEAMAGRWASIMAGTQAGVALLMAVVGPRVSARTWIAGSNALVGLAAVIAAFAPSAAWTDLVAALVGTWLVVRISAVAPYVFRLTPGRDGTVPMALQGIVSLPVIAVSAWVAGLLLDRGLSYRAAFLFTGAVSVTVACWFAMRAPRHGRILPREGSETT